MSASGAKKTAVVTGASSGLGLYTAKALVERGDYFVVMACRNVAKGQEAAKQLGFPADSYEVMELELGDLANVRNFVKKFRGKKYAKSLQSLICNAAIYYPNAVTPTFTKDGFEETVGVTHLGHFLLANLMLKDLVGSQDMGIDKRLCIVGSVTANTNTLAGQVPPRANLGDMSGLAAGLNGDRNANAMIDGDRFIGPKAYKDAKLCNILTVKEMSNRWHEQTGVTFSTMYPAASPTPRCSATTPRCSASSSRSSRSTSPRATSPCRRLAAALPPWCASPSTPRLARTGRGRVAATSLGQLLGQLQPHRGFRQQALEGGRRHAKAKEMFDMSVQAVCLKAGELGPGSYRACSGGPSLPNPFKALAGAK